MKYPLSLIALTVLLTACGGGSSSSSKSEIEQKPDTSGQFCGTSLILQGIVVKISDFDTDKNGCINAVEQKNVDAYVAEEVARIKAEAVASKAAKTMSADGENTSTKATPIKINKLTVTGNADVSDNKVQIHSNMSLGRFEIVTNIDVPKGSTDQIRFMFAQPNTDAVPATGNNIGLNGEAFSENAQIGKNLTLDCNYTTTKLDCSFGVEPLNTLTLSHTPPAALELVVLACEGNTDTCPNRGKVNVSLN